MWDVFISYASEDLERVAQPLAHHLTLNGLKVWMDSTELRGGESIRERIDSGLSSSRFGVIIASHIYFSKRWALSEMDALITLETGGKIGLVVVRYGVTHQDLMKLSILLAGRSSLTTDYGIENLAFRIRELVHTDNARTYSDPIFESPKGRFRLGPRELSFLAKLSYFALAGALLLDALKKPGVNLMLYSGLILQHMVYAECIRTLGFLLYGSKSWRAWVPGLNFFYISHLERRLTPQKPSCLVYSFLILLLVAALLNSLSTTTWTLFLVGGAIFWILAILFAGMIAWVLPLSLLFHARHIVSLKRPLPLILLSAVPMIGSLAVVHLAYPDYFSSDAEKKVKGSTDQLSS